MRFSLKLAFIIVLHSAIGLAAAFGFPHAVGKPYFELIESITPTYCGLMLALALIHFAAGNQSMRMFWSGFASVSAVALLFLICAPPYKMPAYFPVLTQPAKWILSIAKPSVGASSSTFYVARIARLLSFWVIPMLGYVGGTYANILQLQHRDNDIPIQE